jgi:hypothetical protein
MCDLPFQAIRGWRMAIDQTRTRYPVHRHPAPVYTFVLQPLSRPSSRPLPSNAQQSSWHHRQSNVSSALGSWTYVDGFSFEFDQVGRTSMTPPQLTRDTPILHVLHPSSPVSGRYLGLDLELTSVGSLLSADACQCNIPLEPQQPWACS